jgi:RimJ/RimL family protein N-acetyltransferase
MTADVSVSPSSLPDGVVVREAEPGDATVLIAYMTVLVEEDDIDIPLAPGEFKYTVEQEAEIIETFGASDNALFLVAVAGEAAVGVLTMQGGRRLATRHAANLGITVARGWRGRGIGSAMLTQAIDWARASGVLTRIDLEVYVRNAGARRLYERHGFKIEGRRPRAIYQGGEYLDEYCMGLLL